MQIRLRFIGEIVVGHHCDNGGDPNSSLKYAGKNFPNEPYSFFTRARQETDKPQGEKDAVFKLDGISHVRTPPIIVMPIPI